MSRRTATYTLQFHVVFYALLGIAELIYPWTACPHGLAGPLTRAGRSPHDLCTELEANPAANLIMYGLAKYHILFSVISTWALLQDGIAQRYVLGLNAINFAADDSWAAAHLHWIGGGPLVLIPQALLVAWDAYLAMSH